MKTNILIIPGYGGSGSEHWQSYWEKEYENIQRVEQDDWGNSQLDVWLERLNDVIQSLDEDCILVGHSLACSLVAHWASKYQSKYIKGAFLVSSSDVDSSQHTPDAVRNFSPMPLSLLPFPSLVIASEDDPYVSLERSQFFARKWGSEFVNIGAFGHINADSALKSWDLGKKLFAEFAEKHR